LFSSVFIRVHSWPKSFFTLPGKRLSCFSAEFANHDLATNP
jgi:hypothetical protein